MPEKARQARSPSAASAPTGATDFSAGTDSPLSIASSILRFFASSRRRSAGTLSPEASSTTSPGTSCSAGRLSRSPPRSTSADSDNILRIASSASSALPSWMKPTIALITITPAITPASTQCPSAAVIADETIRT